MEDFGPALARADRIVLTDIYAAGEDPLNGVTLEALAAAIRRTVGDALEVVPRLADVPAAIARTARWGDVVLTLGAGSIGGAAERVVEALRGSDR
jgi:UDP-N-acetylmuramate--alanine ligase